MSSATQRTSYTILTLAVIAGFLGVVQWSSDPRPSAGQSPPDTRLSIVFAIDSSPNMFPWDGKDYFEMAKQGIIGLLEADAFAALGHNVGVMQFCATGAPGYVDGSTSAGGTMHWFAPAAVTGETKAAVIDKVARIEPCQHFTRSLMETGIREATTQLALPALSDTSKHIVLIGTGEYRLPQPCPPDNYNKPPDPEGWGAPNCEDESDLDCEGELEINNCRRTCHVRYFAAQARAGGITLSAAHVGPTWRNFFCYDREPDFPYGDPPIHCPDATGFISPAQPDREGFLQEITRAACPSSPLPSGEYIRMQPLISFDPGAAQQTADDLTSALKQWVCKWDGALSGGPDGDAIPDLCDNCPGVSNADQRDCNADGEGDACQTGCGTSVDGDEDGLCEDLDDCHGGDDCLIRYWLSQDPALQCEVVGDLSTCGCDCDANGEKDLCQAASELGPGPLSDDDQNGVADCTEQSPATCMPVPEICQLERLVPSGHVVEFNDRENSEDLVAYLSRKGLRWQGDPAAITWFESASYVSPYAECDDPPTSVGYVSIDAASPAGQGILESMEFVVPTLPCQRCSSTATTAAHACPLVGPSTYVAVDIELRLDAASGSSDAWHIVLKDTCNHASAVDRAHLVLDDSPSNSNIRVSMEKHDSAAEWPNLLCEPSGSRCEVNSFSYSTWVVLRIVFNHADAYYSSDALLICREEEDRPDPSIDSVAVSTERCGSTSTNRELTAETRQVPGLPDRWEYERLSLQIYPESQATHTLSIGRIRIATTNGCEFSSPEAYPCASEQVCRCFSNDQWKCDSPTSSACHWPYPPSEQ